MKKSLIILLVVSFLFILDFQFACAEIRINEVELNPEGNSDNGNEWIELYSNEEVNLTNYEIRSNNGKNMSFNASFSEYFILIGTYHLLTDTDNKLYLYDNDFNNIFETETISDFDNDNSTWQYCNGNWNFAMQTKNSENNCTEENNSDEDESKISLSMDWNEEDIINGEEFEIEIKVEDLEDKEYDVKIWIESDDDTIISDRYDEENDEWKSGTYYVDNFFKGPGDKTEEITLRIRDGYEDFEGDAKIYFKIKDGKEIDKKIEILEIQKEEEDKEESSDEEAKRENEEEKETTTTQSLPITGNVIKLGSSKDPTSSETKDIRTNNNIVYESKDNKIKEYALFGFALLCVGLAVLVIFKKL